MKEKEITLFGTSVLLGKRAVKVSGGLVIPNQEKKDQPSAYDEFYVAHIGPDVKNVKVDDVVILPYPSKHQAIVIAGDHPVGYFLVDENQIRGIAK